MPSQQARTSIITQHSQVKQTSGRH
jgi:hypothetical protein